MLMIPPIPSGSYFAEGLLITSTRSIMAAGILSTMARRSPCVRPLGLPSISTFTFWSPRRLILPSISTSTEGIFFNASDAVPPITVRLWSTKKIFLSMVCMNWGKSPMTSTSAICTADNSIATLPMSCSIPPPSPGKRLIGPILTFS